jgi:hypothetical protein
MTEQLTVRQTVTGGLTQTDNDGGTDCQTNNDRGTDHQTDSDIRTNKI